MRGVANEKDRQESDTEGSKPGFARDHIAKGGSAWRRVTRAAKWFLLGAAAGAVAAKTTR